jgi:4-aminobutyrate aminotransferase
MPMLPGVHHVDFPDPYRTVYDRRRFKSVSEHCISQIHEDLFQRQVLPENVAAIFVEPMLGEGGYVIPPVEFIRALRKLCDQHGILLVFDEIQTGVGRTGKMWAAEYFGVEPDVLLSAKGIASGMPIGAIIAKESVMKWKPGSHGSTFGGNPLSCAAALQTVDIVEKELLPNVRKMGARIMAGLRRLERKFEIIGDVRGVGLFIGVEFVKDRRTKEPAKAFVNDLMQRAFRKGLLLLSCGESVIRIAPPLSIDAYAVDRGLEILEECLQELT